MTSGSVFDVLSTDRRVIRWEDHCDVLTPVEERSGRLYKREDRFAPLGYGGINGTKLRQLIGLVADLDAAGVSGLVTGASVLSPQIPMTALVGAHFGLPVIVVVGGTSPEKIDRHPGVRIARAAGADFAFAPVGYNPTLQREVGRILDDLPGWGRVHYGITTGPGASDAEIEAFHRRSANQVANVPADVERLAVAMGSANSCASILYGIALHRPAGLSRVTLFGVGPNRVEWLDARLAAIERASGVEIRSLFGWTFHDHPEWARSAGEIEVEHYDLHATGFASYGDRMPATVDGIEFHPTYEGKIVRYMIERPDRFRWWWRGDGRSLLWIVGSEPKAPRR